MARLYDWRNDPYRNPKIYGQRLNDEFDNAVGVIGGTIEPHVYLFDLENDGGAADQSASIQDQIDYCETQGICEAVLPPYLVWGEELVISHPLLLRGTGIKVAMGNLADGLPSDVGTRLIAKTGTNPCIDIVPGTNGATITGIQFLQEHDPDAPLWTPTVYAPAIRTYSAWTTIEKCSFWGCYDGVRLGKAWADPGSGYVIIRNNTFSCFHRGIHVYAARDWNLIEANWFQNYFVENLTNQREYIQANAEAIFIERADALEIANNGVFGHLYGIRTGINADAPSEAEGIAERLKLSNNDFDKVRVGILLVKRCTGEAVNTNIVGDNVAGSFAIQGNENVQFQFTNTRTINHGVQAIIAAETGCVFKFRNLTVVDAALDGATTVFSCAAGATIHRDGGFTATGTYTGIEGGAGTYITGATIAGTETLTNKTLTAPTITVPNITGGGALAGTFSGNPTFSGTVTLSGLASLTGGQLAFPATQNASADANTLDDYEEGSWTPVLSFVTAGDSNIVLSTATGRYTKVGDTVDLWWQIATSTFTHTTASGNVQVTGLPFAANNATTWRGSMRWQGITKTNFTEMAPSVVAAGSIITVQASGSAQTAGPVTTADMPTGGTVQFSGHIAYKV